jgi:hypothetical protein
MKLSGVKMGFGTDLLGAQHVRQSTEFSLRAQGLAEASEPTAQKPLPASIPTPVSESKVRRKSKLGSASRAC